MEEVTPEEIEKVCADANILEFIHGLPDGFETKVGGKGSQLSGGQKREFHFIFVRYVIPDYEIM